MAATFASILLCLSALANPCIAGYTLDDDYSPSNFFDKFSFYTGSDPTNGFVDYVSQKTAQDAGLVSTSSNSIYVGVDNENITPGGRPSVRLTSNAAYNHGLFLLDLAHMPHGCGTWPAFWMFGPNWPNRQVIYGEIDIIEGVHEATSNAMTLHTSSGCKITNNNLFTGSMTTDNCDVNAPGQSTNAGCSIAAESATTYGSGFNSNGGGVYATEWTSDYISIYFFPRGSIPSDISSGKPDPTGWGSPLAMFQGDCDLDKYIQNQNLVFDITFCGDWAGAVWSSSSCSSKADTCNAFVENNPSAFSAAYWSINSLQVYQDDGNDASGSKGVVLTSASAAAAVPAPTSITVLDTSVLATTTSTSISAAISTISSSSSISSESQGSSPSSTSSSSTSSTSSSISSGESSDVTISITSLSTGSTLNEAPTATISSSTTPLTSSTIPSSTNYVTISAWNTTTPLTSSASAVFPSLVASNTSSSTVPTVTSVTASNSPTIITGTNTTATQSTFSALYVTSTVSTLSPSNTFVVSTSTIADTAPASTTTAPPTPQQPGIVASCNKYYYVVWGDYCLEVAAAFNITLAQFLAWNTDVNAQCTNLWAEYYACVGVAPVPTNTLSATVTTATDTAPDTALPNVWYPGPNHGQGNGYDQSDVNSTGPSKLRKRSIIKRRALTATTAAELNANANVGSPGGKSWREVNQEIGVSRVRRNGNGAGDVEVAVAIATGTASGGDEAAKDKRGEHGHVHRFRHGKFHGKGRTGRSAKVEGVALVEREGEGRWS